MRRKVRFDWVDVLAAVTVSALIGFAIQSQVETAYADIPEGVTLRWVQKRTNVVDAFSTQLFANASAYDSFVTTCCGDTTPAGDTIYGDTTCCDTTVRFDTLFTEDTSQLIPLGSARRASRQYQVTHVDAVGLDLECDTCVDARIITQWSNDGIYWWDYDSTAAITDTLPHIDTMIVRPYAYCRFILRPTDPNGYVVDTVNALGPEWQVATVVVQPWYWPPSAVRAR